MADYHPLIARAVEALQDRSPEMRQAVYARARDALVNQLRGLDPPLSEADITRERLSLDDAIDRVESEYVAEPVQPPPLAFSLPTAVRATDRVQPAWSPPEDGSGPFSAEPDPAPSTDEGGTFQDAMQRYGAPPASYRQDEAPAAYDQGDSAPRERPRIGAPGPALSRPGRFRAMLLGLIIAVVVAAIAVVAWVLRDEPAQLAGEPEAVEAPRAPDAGDAKFGDRIGGGERPGSAQAPAAAQGGSTAGRSGDLAVAQRAILYEENPANPQTPKASAGRALWRLDTVNPGQGQPLEAAVRGTVEIPEQQLTLNFVLRRNSDPSLPASHTIELTFVTPPGDPGRVVRDIGLLQLKNEESMRGTPMAGLPVPVKDNVFLIGLSNLENDIERNRELLLRRNWIDLPIRFASGQRGIISFEKGVSGDQVMAQAFEQWK